MSETIRVPKTGEVYRHFKGNDYRIVTLAEDTETGETLVIYQALYGEGKIFARELHLFLETIDKNRYPGATQEHRFEIVKDADACVDEGAVCRDTSGIGPEEIAMAKEEVDEGSLHPMLLAFLDAGTYEERLDILGLMHSRKVLTEDMLKTMAIAVDLNLADGDLEDKYEQLKYAIITRKKVETTRLRG